MRYCCKNDLPEESFNKNKNKPDGLATECKVCKKRLDKEYRERHKDKIRLTKQEYYLENREHTIARTSLYAKQNRVKHNAWGTKAKDKLKLEVFSVYSCGNPKCKNCNEIEIGVLTIDHINGEGADHINGEGADHRRELFGDNKGGGYKMYQWLKKNNYPSGFQVLCYNCQFRKRLIEMKSETQTHLKEVRAAYARSIKIECLEQYGGCCCPCGEIDIDVLTLDHVSDDGAYHRRQLFGNQRLGGNNFYHTLRKSEFPNDPPLQVLCMNCNIRKRNAKYQEGKDRQTNGCDGSTIIV
jgi:hypothetical protein